MINIPISINIGNSVQQANLGDNLSSSDASIGFNGLMSLLNSESQNVEDSITTDISIDDLKEIIFSLEEFISDLISEEEDVELNEDISFLQAVIPLITHNEEILIASDNNNLNQLIETISAELKNYKGENINENDGLGLEFIEQIDNDFLKDFKKLDNLELKKEALITNFKEFIDLKYTKKELDNLGINGFYNAFKAISDSSVKSPVDLNDTAIDSIESLDANDMIEMLSSSKDSSKLIDNSQSIKSSNVKTFVINHETLADDLYSTIMHMKNVNLKQLKLKLSPKELGEMTIDISQLENVSKIVLTVSNQDTFNIIKSNLKQILEHLKTSNLISSEASITVQADSSNKESFSTSSGFSSNENKKKKNSLENDLSEVDSISASQDAPTNSDSRILNILA